VKKKNRLNQTGINDVKVTGYFSMKIQRYYDYKHTGPKEIKTKTKYND
jgi:hypothetical protein